MVKVTFYIYSFDVATNNTYIMSTKLSDFMLPSTEWIRGVSLTSLIENFIRKEFGFSAQWVQPQIVDATYDNDDIIIMYVGTIPFFGGGVNYWWDVIKAAQVSQDYRIFQFLNLHKDTV